MIKLLSLLFIFSIHFSARSADFFLTDYNLWFDHANQSQVNAFFEMKGLPVSEVDLVFKRNLPLSIYQKIHLQSISTKDNMVRASLNQVNHVELVKIDQLKNELSKKGGRSLAPEIPFAVRVHNLKGHNSFISQVTGLPLKTIEELDRATEESQRTGKPLLVRYFLDDREKEDPKDFNELKPFYGDAVITQIPADSFGHMPLYVDGNSVVFHSRSFHGKTIVGKYNPGLTNSIIAQALTANKYVESLFWNQYAPEALPETHLLSLMNLDLSNVQKLVAELNKRFPNGWVMKGVNESSSNFSIITDKTNLVEEIEAYKKSDFENFKAEVYRKMAGFDEDNIYEALQEHKNYFGWRASLYLKNAQNVIVQKKVAIDREFRVEALAGQVLKGATIDRHNWYLEMKGLPFDVSSPDLIARIESYTQSIIDKLPPELREMNFAFDIALLQDGHFIAIESNAGSESGFLTNQDTSVRALNEFLRKYPDLAEIREKLHQGMDAAAQLTYLRERFQKWHIDPQVYYPNYTFGLTELDVGFKAHPNLDSFKLNPKIMTCRSLF